MELINTFTILLKIRTIGASIMLFFFTLKFIFKMKKNTQKNRLKLKREDQKELWNFIYKTCDETGAPKLIYI